MPAVPAAAAIATSPPVLPSPLPRTKRPPSSDVEAPAAIVTEEPTVSTEAPGWTVTGPCSLTTVTRPEDAPVVAAPVPMVTSPEAPDGAGIVEARKAAPSKVTAPPASPAPLAISLDPAVVPSPACRDTDPPAAAPEPAETSTSPLIPLSASPVENTNEPEAPTDSTVLMNTAPPSTEDTVTSPPITPEPLDSNRSPPVPSASSLLPADTIVLAPVRPTPAPMLTSPAIALELSPVTISTTEAPFAVMGPF